MKNEVYLAAPFFNVGQQSIVTRVEELCKFNDVHLESPRNFSTSKRIRDEGMSSKLAEVVILQNTQAIKECDLVLAHLEYIVQDADRDWPWSASPFPDTGVVWEVAYAFAMKIPVIGFVTQSDTVINLMLKESMMAIIPSMDELAIFVKNLGGNITLLTDAERDYHVGLTNPNA